MASSLFLTERDAEFDDNAPKVKGRIVTTLPKAKELRPIVEKCITIARRSLQHSEAAAAFESNEERGSDGWKSWRKSDSYQKWNAAMAPALAARRRVLKMLGDTEAVSVVFDEIAPRFADRPGGYTRIMRLAKPRLGDAGQQAILEFVGVHDRVAGQATKPAFGGGDEDAAPEAAEEDTAGDADVAAETEAETDESAEVASEEGDEASEEDSSKD